jgi:hypothetical protein
VDIGLGVYNFSFVPSTGTSNKIFVLFDEQPVPGPTFVCSSLPSLKPPVCVCRQPVHDGARTRRAGCCLHRRQRHGCVVFPTAQLAGTRVFMTSPLLVAGFVGASRGQVSEFTLTVADAFGNLAGAQRGAGLADQVPTFIDLASFSPLSDPHAPCAACRPQITLLVQPVPAAGSSSSTASGTELESPAPLPAAITDNGDGSYLVSFTAPDADSFRLDVRLAGKPIRNSPFTVTGALSPASCRSR